LKANDSKKKFHRLFIYILILVLSFASLASNTALLRTTYPVLADERPLQDNPLNSISPQELVVDIYTEKTGRGVNVSFGTYEVGDTIKVFIFVNQNCTIEEDLITPDGSVWVRMYGPVNNGTIMDYVDTQYPIGKWTLSVKAEAGATKASDMAVFEVIDKAPPTCTKTWSIDSGMSTIEETRFDGKVVNIYRYPVGGVYGWDILVDKVYFGPEIGNLSVKVQLMAITYTLGYPPGYVDASITLGDQVEVYGLLNQEGRDISVTLNGSENYYIKKSSTLCESPELILFTREVFASNLTVRINGVAIPGSQNATIKNVNWNWGDGQSSDQQFPAAHTYSKTGTYVILVKVLQSNGLSRTKSLSISIPEDILSQSTQTTSGGSLTSTAKTEPVIQTRPEEGLWATSLIAITIGIALASVVATRSRMKRSRSNKPNQDNANCG